MTTTLCMANRVPIPLPFPRLPSPAGLYSHLPFSMCNRRCNEQDT